MAFLTVSNSLSILRKIDFEKTKGLEGTVYKKEIYFLSPREKNILLGAQELFKDGERFIAEYYIPIEREDKLKYVFEGGQPAYHKNIDCERLHSNFINFEIPEELKIRALQQGGVEQVNKVVAEFRSWFKTQMHLLEQPMEFAKKLEIRWNIQINPKSINYENSGATEKENLNLNELETRINEILRSAGRFFNENPTKQYIIRRFAKYTFLAYYRQEIRNNDTGLTDEELRDFLREYDIKFKKPVMDLLIEYYRVLFNPELNFEGHLLEKLGFKPCASCHDQCTTLDALDSMFELADVE